MISHMLAELVGIQLHKKIYIIFLHGSIVIQLSAFFHLRYIIAFLFVVISPTFTEPNTLYIVAINPHRIAVIKYSKA